MMTEMEVNDDTYSPDGNTNYDQCIDLEHPGKQAIKKEEEIEHTGELLAHSIRKGRRAYRKYLEKDKEYFFGLVYEKDLKAAQDAMKLGMCMRTT